MGKSVLFVQQKGGAGKTMLLTQLAVHLAQSGAVVTVIDLDPQRSTAAISERPRKRPTGSWSMRPARPTTSARAQCGRPISP